MSITNFFKAGWIILVLSGCKDDVLEYTPFSGPITESVYASGVIKAVDQYAVYSQVNGVLHDILVQASDTVAVDDSLFILRDIQAQLNNQNAEILLQLSKAQASPKSERIRELDEQVKLAKATFVLDSTLFDRQARLWEQGIGSQVEMEQRQLSMVAAQTNLNASIARRNDVKRQLETAYNQAEVNYTKTKESMNEYVVRSAIAGKVYDIQREPGELITVQTPMAVIGSVDQFLVELQVDEYDITRIIVGQAVKLSMESYSGEVFDATVIRINPIMNERTRTFLIEASFDAPPDRLYPFLTAEASIVIQEKEHALTIPTSYLINEQQVITSSGDTVRVVTGLRDMEKIEILSGIDSTTLLLKPGKQ